MGRRLFLTLAVLELLTGAAKALHAQRLAMTRVRIDSSGVLSALRRRGFALAGLETRAGTRYAVVVATRSQQERLTDAGFTVIGSPPPAPATPKFFHDFDSPTTGLAAEMAALADRDADVTLDTIGQSVEGRVILALKIGSALDAPTRPNVLFVGVHHAREWISAEMALRLAGYLADSSDARALLSDRDIWIVPVLNPDGYQYTFDTDRLWRKNRRPNPDGSFGVDLNRNYPQFWGYDDTGSSPTPASETYRGPAPASEPETRALMQLVTSHPMDAAVSYHSYGDLLLYPYGFEAGRLPPDAPGFTALAGTPLHPALVDHLSGATRTAYHPGPGWQLYQVNGDFTGWAYRRTRTLAFTVELTAGCCIGGESYDFEFPDDSAAIDRVFEDNLPFALAVIEAAGHVEGVRGPSGISADATTVESLWPVLRVVGAPGAGGLAAMVTAGGNTTTLPLSADSLDVGRVWTRWSGSLANLSAGSEVSIPALGIRVGLLAEAGAEPGDGGWTGWARDSTDPWTGRYDWYATDDTLRSPLLALGNAGGITLSFWTKHETPLGQPERAGVVEASVDGGTAWVPVARVAGNAPTWYPVHAALPAAGHLMVRFVAQGAAWWIDAIQIFASDLPTPVAVDTASLGVSENPVRSNRLFFTWTPAGASAVVSVFTFSGDLVWRGTASGGAGELVWHLVNVAGAPVQNGAYVAVLQLGSRVLRRRLFVARRR